MEVAPDGWVVVVVPLVRVVEVVDPFTVVVVVELPPPTRVVVVVARGRVVVVVVLGSVVVVVVVVVVVDVMIGTPPELGLETEVLAAGG